MNIALWAPFLKKRISGFESFIVETIPQFTLREPNISFFIITDAEPSCQLALPGNTEIIITKSRHQSTLLNKIWWNVQLPAVLKKIKADLFVSFAENCSLTAVIPQFIVIGEPEKLKSSSIKKAQLVFVMSESIKTQLIEKYKAAHEKIVVIYPAPGTYHAPVDANKREEIKATHSESKEFFLYNSRFEKQEDLIDLLKSFSHFKKRQQSGFKLLLFVESNPFFEKTISAYKYRNDIKFVETKDKNVQAAITSAAYAAVLPFNTSGDIIAALNGMRSGVPVITTKLSSINEVAGDAAVYAENETKDIGDKMIQVYTNEDFRSRLIERGKETVKGFTHEKAAERLWQSIINAYKMI